MPICKQLKITKFSCLKYDKVESRKFEVLGTTDFMSKYRKFQLLGGRHKNI